MAETFGFFDAEELADGTFDREYLAEQWANYFKLFVGNGVFSSPTNQLKVVEYSGMYVKLLSGYAWINGYWYRNDADLVLQVPANMTATEQTHGVFIQFDIANREIHTIVAEGRTTVNRISPYYELKVAEIAVPVGATQIVNANITDTRPVSAVCGFVTGLINVIDSTDLFAQYQAIFDEFMTHIVGTLDGDTAGHLQLEIDNIERKVGAPEVYDSTHTYHKGDYCLNPGGLTTVYMYRCTDTTTGAFDSSKWTQTTILEEMMALSAPSFTSLDDDTTTDLTTAGMTPVSTLTNGEKFPSILRKISGMFKNIRKLWNMVNIIERCFIPPTFSLNDGMYSGSAGPSGVLVYSGGPQTLCYTADEYCVLLISAMMAGSGARKWLRINEGYIDIGKLDYISYSTYKFWIQQHHMFTLPVAPGTKIGFYNQAAGGNEIRTGDYRNYCDIWKISKTTNPLQ